MAVLLAHIPFDVLGIQGKCKYLRHLSVVLSLIALVLRGVLVGLVYLLDDEF